MIVEALEIKKKDNLHTKERFNWICIVCFMSNGKDLEQRLQAIEMR